jgi:hypothetical protein
MDMNDVLLNANAKKIQKVFRKYRVNLYRNKINNLDLNNYAKLHSFNDFCIYIKKREVIDVIKTYLNILKKTVKKELKTKYQLILSCYMINNYTDDVLGKNESLNQSDKDLLKWCKEIVNRLNNGGINIYEQHMLLRNFQIIFNSWKEMDKHKTIEKIIISYNNRNEHLKVLLDDKKMDEKQKEDSINEIERQMKTMILDIKMIDPDFNVKYLEENVELVYSKMKEGWMKITSSLGNTMKKAYHDVVKESLGNGELKPSFDLLMEICKRLLLICPEKRKESLKEKMSESVLMNLLVPGDWSSNLVEFLKFLTDLIILLGASADDKENLEWKNATNLYYNLEFKVVLPQFLIEMQEKIDRIYQLIALYSEANENNI